MLKKFAEQINEEAEVTSEVVSEELEAIQESEDTTVSQEELEEAKKSVKSEEEDEKSDEEDKEEMDEEAEEDEDEEAVEESKSVKSEEDDMEDDDDDDDDDDDEEEEMDEMAGATKSEILAASMKMLKQANKESLYAGYQALKASSCGSMKEEAEDISVDVSEDVEALLSTSDAELSEEFKNKATTIFEAAVKAKVTEQLDAIEQSVKADAEVKLEEARSELAEKVDGYLNYVVEEWVKENELAIERGIKTEIAEEFMAGLKNLFVENYIDVPEEKADLLDELATKSEDLEAKLNEEFEKNVEMKKELDAMKAKDALSEACEGLTATQVEKMQGLAEGIEFETIDQYREKLETIKESYFPKVRATGAEKEDSKESDLSHSEPLNETMSIYARTLSSMKK